MAAHLKKCFPEVGGVLDGFLGRYYYYYDDEALGAETVYV